MTTGFYSHPDCQRHDVGDWHPECPSRLQAIDDQLISSRIDSVLQHESAPLADDAALLRVHTPTQLAWLRDALPGSGTVEIDPDTFLCPASWQAARRAAGAAIAATDAVIDGQLDNAFCSIRPPGHHASGNRAMGFCLLNNVAVAAAHALEVRGLKRVAIIDFDVHHGNGTEAIFAGDSRVLMCSIFQHPLFPFSGVPASAPNILNVPLPERADGAALRDAVNTVWLPALADFAPEMIFISAGFDAHREDELGHLALVEDDFAWVTQRVFDVAEQSAQGRIVSCLEGGYALSALGRCVVAHLRVLAGL
jgi:acetoin utilization deacetylase AcuC-like enzyme